MGYTHYWDFNKTPTKLGITKAVSEIEMLFTILPSHSTSAGGHYEEHPLKLFGGLGKGKPIVSFEKIWFNGDDKGDLGHETFVVEFGDVKGFNFCKTARKPYDFAVCLCLLSLANYIDGFGFSSDGDMDDWKPVIEFYQRHVPFVSENLKKSISSFFVTQ